MARQKTIITCAVTGAIHTPTMSRYLPVTHDDIARQAIDAAEAGASILHLHTRDPDDRRPSVAPDHYASSLGRGTPATGGLQKEHAFGCFRLGRPSVEAVAGSGDPATTPLPQHRTLSRGCRVTPPQR